MEFVNKGLMVVMVMVAVVGFGVVNGSLFEREKKIEILEKHNEMRKGEPASNMRKLTWNGVLARMASEWAEKCGSVHGQPYANDKPYKYIGQNMNIFSTRQSDYVSSINAWMDEKAFYDFESMTCQEGKKCGHYRQLVWAESYEIGCGYAKCDKVSGLNLKFGDVFVCNYGPAGNIKGLKPYKVGEKCSACGRGFQCEGDICVSTKKPTHSFAPYEASQTTGSGMDLSDLPPEFDI